LEENSVGERLRYNEFNDHLAKLLGVRGFGSEIVLNGYKELYFYINLLTCMANTSEMTSLLDLAYRRDLASFSKTIFDDKPSVNILDRVFKFQLPLDASLERIDIMNSCLFVVKDLKSLIDNVNGIGYVFNAGPQK
jgi:hypothetical protein